MGAAIFDVSSCSDPLMKEIPREWSAVATALFRLASPSGLSEWLLLLELGGKNLLWPRIRGKKGLDLEHSADQLSLSEGFLLDNTFFRGAETAWSYCNSQGETLILGVLSAPASELPFSCVPGLCDAC